MTIPPTTPPAAPTKRRAWLGAAIALVLTFAAGLALGWGIGVRTTHMVPRRTMDQRHSPFERLNLTPAQQAAVDSIFRVRRHQIARFWEGPGRQLGVILDSTSTDIRTVLDSAQRTKFDEFQRRFKDARKRGPARPSTPGHFGDGFGGGMPPGPPGPPGPPRQQP